MDTDTSVMRDRIGQICHQFKLPTMGAQSVARFTEAGYGDALPTFLEVLEQEAEDRRHRRINRLHKESRLPSGQAWETFEHDRMPLALPQQLDQLAQGSFVDRGVNMLAFCLPGTGKSHALCAVGHRLVESGRSVLFAPAYLLVQELLADKRDVDLPRRLRRLDNFDFLLLDDLGYLPQGAEESEVLFTLIAERYERRFLGITSNLVSSEWERIFANPMATPAAIDRVVHHSVILEFDFPATGLTQHSSGASQRGEPAKPIDAKSAKIVDAGPGSFPSCLPARMNSPCISIRPDVSLGFGPLDPGIPDTCKPRPGDIRLLAFTSPNVKSITSPMSIAPAVPSMELCRHLHKVSAQGAHESLGKLGFDEFDFVASAKALSAW